MATPAGPPGVIGIRLREERDGVVNLVPSREEPGLLALGGMRSTRRAPSVIAPPGDAAIGSSPPSMSPCTGNLVTLAHCFRELCGRCSAGKGVVLRRGAPRVTTAATARASRR